MRKMRRVAAVALSACMVASMVTGCGGSDSSSTSTDDTAATEAAADDTEAATEAAADDTEAATEAAADDSASGSKGTINLWTFTDEVPGMVDKFLEANPDFGYDVNSTIIATTDGAYQPALDQALAAGGADAPDLYCAEEAFVLKYTQGDMAQFAAPYADLGIDVDAEVSAAEIAPYTIDIGTNKDGNLVALGYQSTGGCFIYRRSIAKDVFGTDDPKEIGNIVGAGTGNFDKFFEAAETLKGKDVAMLSGMGDLWTVIKHSADEGWLNADGKLHIDPKIEQYMDYSKTLIDNGYTNDTSAWADAWFADMKDEGTKKVFGFFGPAWLINYTLAPNCGGEKVGEGTYGDWAVCESPVGFFWGGTWLMANKDSEKKEAVGQIIDWITLNCTEDGLQYKWANGTLNGEGGTKDVVASNTVLGMSDGTLDFLGGQNMFDSFIPANSNASGKTMTQYDETINTAWQDQASQYAHGEKDKETAIADFKTNVSDQLGVEAE